MANYIRNLFKWEHDALIQRWVNNNTTSMDKNRRVCLEMSFPVHHRHTHNTPIQMLDASIKETELHNGQSPISNRQTNNTSQRKASPIRRPDLDDWFNTSQWRGVNTIDQTV